MKTTGKIAAVAAFTWLILAAAGLSGCSTPAHEKNANQNTQYTCLMHPNIVQYKPGKCPLCGMDLVEKQ